MKKIEFSIKINASKEKVWATLWNDSSYRQWTSVFAPDSHAVSDWKQGSTIKFIDNKGDGMYSIIQTNLAFVQMSFKHLGEIKDAIEINVDWEDSIENYFLNESNGVTELKMNMDIKEEYEEYFINMFPKALELIKQISEKN